MMRFFSFFFSLFILAVGLSACESSEANTESEYTETELCVIEAQDKIKEIEHVFSSGEIDERVRNLRKRYAEKSKILCIESATGKHGTSTARFYDELRNL